MCRSRRADHRARNRGWDSSLRDPHFAGEAAIAAHCPMIFLGGLIFVLARHFFIIALLLSGLPRGLLLSLMAPLIGLEITRSLRASAGAIGAHAHIARSPHHFPLSE